jgi:hypothetical protein
MRTARVAMTMSSSISVSARRDEQRNMTGTSANGSQGLQRPWTLHTLTSQQQQRRFNVRQQVAAQSAPGTGRRRAAASFLGLLRFALN